jgi:restriction system protein
MDGFWKIIAGRENRYIEDFEAQGCIAIGWADLGDLSDVESEEELARRYDQSYTDENPVKRGVALASIGKFRFRMKPGDAVISYDPGSRQYLWGQIKGDYAFRPGQIGDYPHVRDVEWQHRISRDDLSQGVRNKTTVMVTVTQPDKDVYDEFRQVIEGEKAEAGALEPEDQELASREQAEKARELIKDRLSKLGWEEMQQLVAAILRAMGYKTQVSPSGPDKGKDIIASPDGLGLEEPRIKVEVKHRRQQMGAQEVRSFLGGLRAGDRGLYVSTGGFSREAEYEAERAPIPLTLVDLDVLAELLVQHYDGLDTEGRALMPLVRLYWPAG